MIVWFHQSLPYPQLSSLAATSLRKVQFRKVPLSVQPNIWLERCHKANCTSPWVVALTAISTPTAREGASNTNYIECWTISSHQPSCSKQSPVVCASLASPFASRCTDAPIAIGGCGIGERYVLCFTDVIVRRTTLKEAIVITIVLTTPETPKTLCPNLNIPCIGTKKTGAIVEGARSCRNTHHPDSISLSKVLAKWFATFSTTTEVSSHDNTHGE